MSILKYFAPDQPLVKVVGQSADGNATLVHVLPTPYGSSQKKDLHGEFFTPNTYFGDDVVTVKFGLYEHLMNDYSNPVMGEMGVQKQILGAARLLTSDEKTSKGLDVAERWFELEVKRSLEYHDMLINMIDAKMMGASTQSFMNGKRRKDDGEITMWIENEISLTPTPANADTIGKVAGFAKAYVAKTKTASAGPLVLPKLMLVKSGQLVEINLETPELALIEPAPVTEPPAANEEKDLAAQISDILENETEAVKSNSVDLEQLQQYIADKVAEAVKASMSVIIELWGANPDEARAAIMQMMGEQKNTSESMMRMEKNLKSVENSFLVLANYMKNQKLDSIKGSTSPREREILDDKKAPPKIKSGVPEHIRAEAK